MKRLLVLLLAASMLVSMSACGKETGNNDYEVGSTQSEFGDTEANQPEATGVESLQFWLDKVENPDEVLLTLKEIEKHNALMMRWWGTDFKSGYHDINVFPESVDKEWLQDRIEYPNVKNLGLYCNGKKVTSSQWKENYKAFNYDKMPAKIDVKYGVLVHSTPGFDFPSAEIFTASNLDESENLIQQTYFRMNEPVVVVWESADKEWYYVVANEYVGWIEAKDCALFKNRTEWTEYQKQENFVVITEDSKIEGIEGTVYMSTKLYLADENEADDSLDGDYIVRVPQRDKNGELSYSYASLSKGDGIHEGYLSYTTRNVLTLAFQELGDPYGWGGIDGKRDCSMYIKDIYNCFGFQLPRNSRIQMNIPEMRNKIGEMTVEEKEELISKTTPGSILGFNGHVMLYLGEDNGQHYVISMLGSYVPEDVTENFKEHVISALRVNVNTLDVKRKNGNTWMKELVSLVEIR